ncbi:hypothetical protein [Candidatus Nitrosocosmicus arcticus]|uniref:Uncharacterized protein n=1 Tax=Candidatus Nitrosocosmicus arcticus TaxID=2035267 RepID=A0A557SVN9_9ARCH|nr:hypothetical protein [Candidatus Nitrosocosmicus arcticus]TVP40665.1 hypothetical protein NARC_60052 [Candidatus Nitrosocosmicus arcticus]
MRETILESRDKIRISVASTISMSNVEIIQLNTDNGCESVTQKCDKIRACMANNTI